MDSMEIASLAPASAWFQAGEGELFFLGHADLSPIVSHNIKLLAQVIRKIERNVMRSRNHNAGTV
jgi:hypothetical protein